MVQRRRTYKYNLITQLSYVVKTRRLGIRTRHFLKHRVTTTYVVKRSNATSLICYSDKADIRQMQSYT